MHSASAWEKKHSLSAHVKSADPSATATTSACGLLLLGMQLIRALFLTERSLSRYWQLRFFSTAQPLVANTANRFATVQREPNTSSLLASNAELKLLKPQKKTAKLHSRYSDYQRTSLLLRRYKRPLRMRCRIDSQMKGETKLCARS